MDIIWHYLDKRGAAINALKDYGSMQYIIDHTDEEIDTIHDKMSSVGSPVLSDLPTGPHNPQANENRIIAAIDEGAVQTGYPVHGLVQTGVDGAVRG